MPWYNDLKYQEKIISAKTRKRRNSMLTDTFLRNVKPADRPKKYGDSGGLFIYVSVTGSRLWRMAYRFDGKSKLLSFGNTPRYHSRKPENGATKPKNCLPETSTPDSIKKNFGQHGLPRRPIISRPLRLNGMKHRPPRILQLIAADSSITLKNTSFRPWEKSQYPPLKHKICWL